MSTYEVPSDVREAFIYLFGEEDLPAGRQGATDETILDAYQGEYPSDEDFAANLLESLGALNEIPDHWRYYFDYEKYARDLMIDTFIEHNHHYFYRNW